MGGVLHRQGPSTAKQGTHSILQTTAPPCLFSSGQAFLLTAACSAASSSVSTLPSFIFTSMASISRPAEGIWGKRGEGKEKKNLSKSTVRLFCLAFF